MKNIKIFLTFLIIGVMFFLVSCDNDQNSEINVNLKYTVTWINYDGTVLEKDIDVIENSFPEYNGSEPKKESTEEFDFKFVGWNLELDKVNSNVEFVALFEPVLRKYKVVWKNFDGTILEEDNEVLYGTIPTYDDVTPSKNNTAEYSYEFEGWDKDVSIVTGNVEYIAKYKSTKNKYKVLWKNYDGTILEEDKDVLYGTIPSYNGTTPTREKNQEFSYEFEGWDKDVSVVTGNVEYIAKYKSTKNKYKVLWKNYDGSILEEDKDVLYGTTPSYNGPTPAKEKTQEFSYVFEGWDKKISKVTGNVEYIAKYKLITNKYIVLWKNYDGIILEEDKDVLYGTTPSYNGTTPTREKTQEYSYEFDGWDKEISVVTGNVEYIAKYKSITNKYTVIWKNYDGIILEEDKDVLYGTIPSYDGIIPYKVSTSEFTYTFKSWNKTLSPIKGDTEFIALFDNITNKYNVIWKNYDGIILEEDKNVLYGTIPSYNGTIPTKASTAKFTYIFLGWDKEISIVTGDEVYIAVFNEIINKYNVLWKDYNDEILEEDKDVLYGSMPEFNGDTPTRTSENNKSYYYEFDGWDKNISLVTGDVEYIAVYKKNYIDYTVSFFGFNNELIKEMTYHYEDLIVRPNLNNYYDTNYDYDLVDWYQESTFDNIFSFNNFKITDSINIYGKYEKNIFGSFYYTLTEEKQYAISGIKSSNGILYFPLKHHGLKVIGVLDNLNETRDYASLYFDGTIEDWCNLIFAKENSNIMLRTSKIYILDKNGSESFNGRKYNELTKIIIPSGIEKIDSNQFSGFGNIIDLYIPSSVKKIDESAFYLCSKLNNVYYDGTIENWCDIEFVGNNPMYYANNFYILNDNGGIEYNNKKYEKLIDLIIPDDINKIGDYQFYGFNQIENITIHENVKEIGNEAFGYCSSIKNLYYEGTIENWCNIYLTSAASNPMSYATNFYILNVNGDIEYNDKKYEKIQNIIIPSEIIEIGSYQFYNFKQIENIYLHNNISKISFDSFFECTSLENVYFGGELENWCNIELINSKSNPMAYANNFYILIDDNYELLSNVLEIPDGVFSIGKYQFYGFNKITDVVLNDSIVEIGTYSFAECTDLINILINSNIKKIDNYVFSKSNNVQNVYFDGRIEDWCNIEFELKYSNPMYYFKYFYIYDENGTVTYKDKNFELLEELIISDEILKIGKNQFYGFTSLSIVKLHNEIDEIGYNSFGNTNIKSITLPFVGETKTKNNFIGYIFGAEDYEYNDKYISYYLTTIILLEKSTNLAYKNFYGCKFIYNLSIPATMNKFGIDVLRNNGIENIYYNGTIDDWCNISFETSSNNPMYYAKNFYILDQDGNVLFNNLNYKVLDKLVITSSVKTIKQFSFIGFKFNVVNFSNSIEKIELDAFNCEIANIYYDGTIDEWCNIDFASQNSNPMNRASLFYIQNDLGEVLLDNKKYSLLTEVTIPNNVKIIKQYCFVGSTSIETVIVENGVEEIEKEAFKDNVNLIKLVLPMSINKIGKDVFFNANKIEDLYYNGTIDDWCEIEFVNMYSNPMKYALNFKLLDANGENEFNSLKYTLIKELIISNNIEEIGNYQFYNFNQLDNIIISESLKKINTYAFAHCYNITNITIPNNVLSIGYSAFAGCESLEFISLPSIDKFGYIFGKEYYHTPSKGLVITQDKTEYRIPISLTDLVLTNCKTIDSYAFENCINLKNIEINNIVEKINNSAFKNVSSLNNFYFNGSIEDWCNIELLTVESNPISNGSDFYIFDEKGDFKFNDNNYSLLVDLIIPNSIKNIGNYQFYNFKMLNIDITNVEKIGYASFECCSNINSIYINSAEIGMNAFNSCSGLVNIVLTENVEIIQINAFANLDSLQNLYYDGTIEDWCNIQFANENSNPMNNASNYYLLNRNGDINYNENHYEKIIELVIPNGVKKIGKYQFYNFNQIENISISNDVLIIDDYALYNLELLSSLELPSNLEKLGIKALANLDIVELTISNSVLEIGKGVLNGSSKIEKINIPFLGKTRNETYHLGYIFGSDIFVNSYKVSQNEAYYIPIVLEEVNVYDSLMIPQYAFAYCQSIKTINILNPSSKISYGAFQGCRLLESLTISNFVNENMTKYPFGALFGTSVSEDFVEVNQHIIRYNDNNENILSTIYNIPSSLKEVTINAKNISAYSFENCNMITNINLNAMTKIVENDAFLNCSLNNVYYDGTIADWCEIEFSNSKSNPMNNAANYYLLDSLGTFNYKNNKYILLDEILVPDSITNIGRYQFFGFKNIINVTIPNSVQYIGEGALGGCSSIRKLVVPFIGEFRYESTMTNISEYPFAHIFGREYFDGSTSERLSIFENLGYNHITYATYYIPESLKELIFTDLLYVQWGAFGNTLDLDKIVFPKETQFSQNAFNRNGKIDRVYYNGTIDDWIGKYIADFSATPMYNSNDFYIIDPNGDDKYYGNNYRLLTDFILNKNITKILFSTFYGFDCLESVYYEGDIYEWSQIEFGIEGNPLKYASRLYMLDSNGNVDYNNLKWKLLDEIVIDKNHIVNVLSINKLESLKVYYDCPYDDIYLFDNRWTNVNEIYVLDENGLYNHDSKTYSKIESIIIPEGENSIGLISGPWFRNIVIPVSVKIIDSITFENSFGLENVYYNGTVNDWASILFYNKFNHPMHYASNFYILDLNGDVSFNGNNYSLLKQISFSSNITIKNYAFHNFKLDKLEILNDKVLLTNYAFDNSEITELNIYYLDSVSYNKVFSLTKIKKLKMLGNAAILKSDFLYGIYGIEIIELADTIEIIDDKAFELCDDLDMIIIPSSVKTIGFYAFSSYHSLNTILYKGTIADWCDIYFKNLSSNPFYNSPLANLYILDENGDYEYGKDKYKLVEKLIIPDTVLELNNSSFVNMHSIPELVVLGEIEVNSSPFYNAIFKKITAPSNIFAAIDYTYEIVEATVTSGNASFNYGCDSLKKINCLDGVKSISVFNCPELEEINMSDSIELIADICNCPKLKDLNIPNSIKKFNNNAFGNLIDIENIYYEGTIEEWLKIEVTDFRANPMYSSNNFYILDSSGDVEYKNKKYTLLKKLELSADITSIGDWRFYGFSQIESIKYNGTISQWNNITKGNSWNSYITVTEVECLDGYTSI